MTKAYTFVPINWGCNATFITELESINDADNFILHIKYRVSLTPTHEENELTKLRPITAG